MELTESQDAGIHRKLGEKWKSSTMHFSWNKEAVIERMIDLGYLDGTFEYEEKAVPLKEIDAEYRDIDDEMAEERELMVDVDDDEEADTVCGSGVCYVDIVEE
jgi:hypothetical protein